MSRGLALVLAAGLLWVGPSARALDGTVVDEKGVPLAGARVCQTIAGVELRCGGTEDDGRFSLPDMPRAELHVTAEGKMLGMHPGTGKDILIELRPAPTLLVKLVDGASGKPIEKGEVFVVFSSAMKKGPFPVNRSGVRVRRLLQAGEVRVLGRAEGYDEAHEAVVLEAGEESVVTLELALTDKK